jgi:hypothetical protein
MSLGTTTNIQDALEEVGSGIDSRHDGIALLTPLLLGHDSRYRGWCCAAAAAAAADDDDDRGDEVTMVMVVQALAQLNMRTAVDKLNRVASVLLLTDGSHNESRFSYTDIDRLYAESRCSGIFR